MLANLAKFDFRSGKINLVDSNNVLLIQTELLFELYETGFRSPVYQNSY